MGHSACEAEISLPGDCSVVFDDMKCYLFHRLLKSGGDVFVFLREGLSCPSRYENVKQGIEADTVSNLVSTLREQAVEGAEQAPEPCRITIGGEAHDLILVEEVVSQILDHVLVKVAERVVDR